MTQEAFNTARDLIRRALIIVAEGLMGEADDEADPIEIATYQNMLNEVQLATLSLERDNAEGVALWLGWVKEYMPDEDDDELECMCTDCAAERVKVAN
jgi:hypothetical protein